jgi:uncharacterized membrane protein
MAVSVILGFILVSLCIFLEVMSVKSSSSAISSRFGGSEKAFAEIAGFCTPCLAGLVPPWEQCTSAATTAFQLPEGHITAEGGLALLGPDCLSFS